MLVYDFSPSSLVIEFCGHFAKSMPVYKLKWYTIIRSTAHYIFIDVVCTGCMCWVAMASCSVTGRPLVLDVHVLHLHTNTSGLPVRRDMIVLECVSIGVLE